MTDNKEIIKQILLGFENFKGQDVWLVPHEIVVDEFVKTQSDKYLIIKEVT